MKTYFIEKSPPPGPEGTSDADQLTWPATGITNVNDAVPLVTDVGPLEVTPLICTFNPQDGDPIAYIVTVTT